MLRRVLIAGGVVLAAVILPIGSLSAYALLAPYPTVQVQTGCPGALALKTQANTVVRPDVGTGVVIASDGAGSGMVVVAVPGPGGATAGGTAYLVGPAGVRAVLPITSRAVAAGFADGIAFMFDDKLGVVLDVRTGTPIKRLFTADNYRGLLMQDGVELVQTSAWFGIVGSSAGPLLFETIPFGVVVDGCLLAVAPNPG